MSITNGNSFYTLVSGSSWSSAQSAANLIGGNLVTINNLSENSWLTTNITWNTTSNTSYGAYGHDGSIAYWIGLTDLGGNLEWVDGSSVSYINGGPFTDDNEDFFTLSNSGSWNDLSESTKSWFQMSHGIAEIPLSYFSISDLTITEGDSGNVTISRTGGTTTAQTLNLASSNGTASAGSDYTAINSTISFAAGETSKIFSISTTEDSSAENNETFSLTLSASVSDSVPAQITDGSATVTIDEAARVTGPSGSAGDSTSTKSINENSTAVHTFSANETVTWALNGGSDSSKFAINTSTGALSFSSAPDYESPTDSDSGNDYVVVVRATDLTGNASEQTLTVSVSDVNEIPSNISLSSSSLNENIQSGSTIATLSSSDPDSTDTHTFSLVSGSGDNDNNYFSIDESSLIINDSPYYETKSSYNIRLQTTDSIGENYTKAFTLLVKEGPNSNPRDISLSSSSLDENIQSG